MFFVLFQCPPPPQAPVCSVNPVATSIIDFVNATNHVSTTTGTWSGSPTFTFNWIAETNINPGIPFTLSTAQAFDDPALNSGGMTAYCAVTATNSYGSVTVNTNTVTLNDFS